MRTIETNIFNFSELSEEAKQNAIEEIRNKETDFFWSNEWMASIKQGLVNFGAELQNYSIDFCNPSQSSFKISNDNSNTEELTGLRLRTWLLNNYYHNFFQRKPQGAYTKSDRRSKITFIETSCPFTGYCGDEDFMDTFRAFIKSPDNRTLDELLNEATEAVIQAGAKDYECQTSDEGIKDSIEANGYEFTETGELI